MDIAFYCGKSGMVVIIAGSKDYLQFRFSVMVIATFASKPRGKRHGSTA
ncbi:hypothetical protein [Oceanidesulfovibrio indonesiensis]|nr:hypothetical protein [Oceanidesulfovibrio indonesiensis]